MHKLKTIAVGAALTLPLWLPAIAEATPLRSSWG